LRSRWRGRELDTGTVDLLNRTRCMPQRLAAECCVGGGSRPHHHHHDDARCGDESIPQSDSNSAAHDSSTARRVARCVAKTYNFAATMFDLREHPQLESA